MTELLTAAQMRAIEQAAIDSGEVTGLELMERAGKGVVEAVFAEWPELAKAPHRAVVLCGPGNNGGDGFVVARLLKEAGWEVEVFFFGEEEKLPPDARVNYDRWQGEVYFGMDAIYDDAALRIKLFEAELVIDAVFGIGLSRPLGDIHSEVWSSFDVDTGAIRRLVAIDIPSGFCADSGRAIGMELEMRNNPSTPAHVFQAELTVTFHRPKLGHYLSDAAFLRGKLRVLDIGLRHSNDGWPSPVVVAGAISAKLCKSVGHKFSYGHALIVSGPHGRAGAARLAARAALRVGAGVVTVASPPDAMAENAARLDAIMLREAAGADGLAGVLADKRINALCLGPGMGVERAAELLPVAVRAQHAPYLVLDADALTALARDPDLFAALHKDCVLTPHAGEFARLFPDIAAKLAARATKGPAYSKVDATREAAARAGCVVLFKGPDTVIADPAGRSAINSAHYDRAAPWLATAGSGDVLAGFITGLLARGFGPFDAACTGAWLHVECARSFGPGLIAEDLPEELPKVFRALGL